MLLKFIKITVVSACVFGVLTLGFYMTMLYRVSHISIASGLSVSQLHQQLGQPCGAAYFKCCGIEVEGGMASHEEVWEDDYWLGKIRTHVYIDSQEQVLSAKKEFQWYFEPAMRGYVIHEGSCLQMMG